MSLTILLYIIYIIMYYSIHISIHALNIIHLKLCEKWLAFIFKSDSKSIGRILGPRSALVPYLKARMLPSRPMKALTRCYIDPKQTKQNGFKTYFSCFKKIFVTLNICIVYISVSQNYLFHTLVVFIPWIGNIKLFKKNFKLKESLKFKNKFYLFIFYFRKINS